MRQILLKILSCLAIFSCAENGYEEIYQGRLEELIVGDFKLVKNPFTYNFYDLRVIEDGGREFILYTTSAQKFGGWAFVFADSKTGLESYRIEIPREGPNSLKVGMLSNIVSGKNEVYLINYLGDVGRYDSLGQQVRFTERGNVNGIKSNEGLGMSTRNGLSYFLDSEIFMSKNPSSIVNARENPGPDKLKSTFPLDFSEWRIKIELNTGNVTTSDFPMPIGYDAFQNDVTATQLQGCYDSKRSLFYLNWPRSEEVYEIDGLKLIRKVIPRSNVDFIFLPSEVIPWGDKYTVWALPKEASTHMFLLYDQYNDLFVRCSKIKESGAGETKFERTKHYVLSIFSDDWEPKGEYFFDFETELDVENWFLTSEGLFINKPEQKSEDAYEFYKIDLSGFVD